MGHHVGYQEPPFGPASRSIVSETRYRRLLAVVVLVGLALRVAWVLWVSREPQGIFLDPSRSFGYARQIAHGNGMAAPVTNDPTAYYPPGYPWFLGIITWVSAPFTDAPWLAAGLVQAVLGTASIVFLWPRSLGAGADRHSRSGGGGHLCAVPQPDLPHRQHCWGRPSTTSSSSPSWRPCWPGRGMPPSVGRWILGCGVRRSGLAAMGACRSRWPSSRSWRWPGCWLARRIGSPPGGPLPSWRG